MASKKSISQNAIFNVIYKAFMYIFPLLISSYVGRILLSDGVGKVSFVQNIVSYFTSLVALGIPTYGIREIAKCKTQQERNIVFSSLFTINAISTIVFSIAYYIMIFTVPYFHNNLLLYTIGGIQIVFNFINIDWLYQGLEEYKYIAIRSLIVRFVSLICVFAFIHSRKDEWIYLLITCAVNVGNYVLNVFRARKIVLLSLKGISLKKHLRSIFILLATVIAVELYTKIDTTFIGIMLSESDVGYYTYADRIVKIPITIFAAINAVILPRLSVYYMSGEKKEFHELLSKINITVLIFAIPTSVGTCLLSSDYILALFGSNFEPAGYLLKILSPLIVIMSIGNLFGTQAVIAIGQEHSKFVATIIAALLNIVGTPILIKQIGAGGACFASVFSETVVLLIYIRIVTIYDKPTLNVRTIINILISTGCMSAIIFLVKHFGMGCWFNTVIGTVAGAVTYCILMLLLDRQFRKLLISVLRKGKF